MGKFDGILLMSDLDGTLCSAGTVSQENCDAIRYFQSEGGLFSVASGRNPDWLLNWKEYFVPNTWSAMINGAVFCDATGKNFIFDQPAGMEIVETAEQVMRACPNLKSVFFCGCNQKPYEVPQGAFIDPELLPSPIYKCLLRTSSEESDEHTAIVKKMLAPNYIVMRSWINGIEFQPTGTGKGDAVHRMKEVLGERARIVVAVGNYENDIDMIAAADIGYAVKDALDSVKAVADRITVPCAEHAIAHVISDLEKIERS
ncbi:MAG: HAD-IIB family hydrolase [Clostridia bacterium]|nr:HAD-IIB family hydrolase [Clostridia bacterium]MBQ7348325.1 HAD-IIB family hydrolase [Clostridia bacterium]